MPARWVGSRRSSRENERYAVEGETTRYGRARGAEPERPTADRSALRPFPPPVTGSLLSSTFLFSDALGNFIHHISGGVVAGAACSAAATYFFDSAPVDAAAIGVLCCASSLLPDIDSPQSKPTELLFGMTSVLAPVFLVQGVGVQQLTPSEIILMALAGYMVVQYVVRRIMQRLTVHRGIFHSIPMALIWGAIVYMAFRHAPAVTRDIAAAGAVLGFFVHLLIDEMFSFINFEGIRLSPKQSFGSAFKFFAPSLAANFFAYMILFILLYFCLSDAGFVGGPVL